jgi:hypothetical protein
LPIPVLAGLFSGLQTSLREERVPLAGVLPVDRPEEQRHAHLVVVISPKWTSLGGSAGLRGLARELSNDAASSMTVPAGSTTGFWKK